MKRMSAVSFLFSLAMLSASADGEFATTNYTFDAKGVRVGVASPAAADEPRQFLLLCDPDVTAETLAKANVKGEVANWWHVAYAAEKSTGDAARDFKRLMDVYDAGVARGFSPQAFKTVAMTPAGKALEARFLSVPRRPKPEQRKFRSKAVDAKVAVVTAALKAKGMDKLALMFENCYPNTLDTTVSYRKGPDGDDETFLNTGDIPAMWLRDSAAQVWPYLRLVKEDEPLRHMIRGVVRKQFEFIRLDPYANGFNDLPFEEANKPGGIQAGVRVKKGVWERKYELDSLCYPIRLAHGYWKASGDASIFDARWLETLRTILGVMREQQHKTLWKSSYFFARPAVCNNAVENGGWGRQVKPVGLIASSFRPSDDATQLPFLVPSNLMAADVLGKAAEIVRKVNRDAALASECEALKAEVEAALRTYAVREHPTAGKIFAFEVDGFGSALFMDDANVPSLIAIPYFTDIPKTNPVYRATREFVWSRENPWFFRGQAGEGIGGPHCGYGSIWPMSVILKGLTSNDPAEMRACLAQLLKTDAGTSFMHESHDKDDASKFSRSWFAWANTLFGEFVLKMHEAGHLRRHVKITDLPEACATFSPDAAHAPSLLPEGKKFKLVWRDEFDGTALDRTKWSYRTNFWGRNAHWFAKPEDNCVEVKDGVVRLKVKKLPNGQFVSPQLQTGELMWDVPPLENPKSFWYLGKRMKPLFAHKYGYYECRCRLQRKAGWWSAFWMQTEMQGACLDPGLAGIEQDIMESFDPGEVIVASFHTNGYGPDYLGFHIPSEWDRPPRYNDKGLLDVDTDEFHTFGLLWEPSGYSVYVDGRLRGRNDRAVSHIPEFVLLTTECKWYRQNRMTGKGVPELEAAVEANDDFVVDHVRVYDIVEEK